MTKPLFHAGLATMLAVLTLVAPAKAQTAQDAPDNPTAYKALHVVADSLGKDALDRVVEVMGRDGAPQPSLWKVVLKEGAGSREIDVENGKITAQRPLDRPPAYSSTIHLSDLNLDSSGAFEATDAQARKVKLRFDSLNYTLRVSDTSGKPVWYIELINQEGTGVGAIRVGAHNGEVISKDGRLASNATPVPVAASTPRPTPKPAVVVRGTPAPRVVSATPTPYPVSTPPPRRVATTTTTTTSTWQRNESAPVVTNNRTVVDSDNVYGQPTQPAPVVEEEGGLFTRTGRTLDHTGHRVEGTLRRAGAKVQRFFTGHSDIDQGYQPEPEEPPSNRPD